MLKLSLFELIFGTIPESILLILSIYLLTNNKVNRKDLIKGSIFISLVIYFIRILPIHYGIHTIIDLIFIILAAVKINKIPLMKAIPASLISVILLSLSEVINLYIIKDCLNLSIKYIEENRLLKVFLGYPSIIIFGIIISIIFLTRNKIKKRGSRV